MSLQSSPTTAKTNPSNLGADEHAPLFSLMRMESAAAEREIGVMRDYERLQDERMNTMRASLLESIRIRESRIRGLRKALWAAATLAALETMGIVLWVVTR